MVFFSFFSSWSFAFWKARVGRKDGLLDLFFFWSLVLGRHGLVTNMSFCHVFLFLFFVFFWSFAFWKARFGQNDGIDFDEEEHNGDDVDCAPELCCFCLELNQLSQQCLYGLAKS